MPRASSATPSLPATPPSPAGAAAPGTAQEPCSTTPNELVPRTFSGTFRGVPESALADDDDDGVKGTDAVVGWGRKPDPPSDSAPSLPGSMTGCDPLQRYAS